MFKRLFPRVGLLILLAIVLIPFVAGSVYTIESGNVGVKKTLGTIDPAEIGPGFHVKLPFVTSIAEYSAKEIDVHLEDLTPKAADNLSLRDFDVTVFYQVAANAIADLRIKYGITPQWHPGTGDLMPIHDLLFKEARRAAYEAVAEMPSLDIHKRRGELQERIKITLQTAFNESEKGAVEIRRVVIRSVRTDPSIEKSIQEAVANQKRLEAKKLEVDIAKEEAKVKIAEAHGIAEANRIINESLTPEYLQHEVNQALLRFADGGANTVVIPANMEGMDLILPAQPLDSTASTAR